MGRFSLKGRFSGREAWKTANLTIVFGLYFGGIFLLMRFPQYLWILGLFMAFFLPSYGYVSERTRRMKAENSKGVRCIEGYTTFAHKKAEEHFFEPVDFEIKEQLSAAVLADVQNYINIQSEHTKYLKTRTGLEGFKQLSYYKETTDNDESNNIEKMKSDKIEKENYEKSKEEYKIITEKELKMKITKNEEPTDE